MEFLLNKRITVVFLAAFLLLFLPAVSSASTLNQPANFLLDGGLVGYWTMDGKDINFAKNQITDRSGNGNTGQMLNMSTTTSTVLGNIGQALNFDGADDYITLPGNLISTTQYSVSLWVKPSYIGAYQGLFSIYTDNTDSMEVFLANDGTLSAGDFADRAFTLTALPINSWHHVVATSDGSVTKIYVDGVHTGVDGATLLSTFSAPATIGKRVTGFPFAGSLDDTRLYNRALSATEIKALYNSGTAKTSATPTTKLTNGLVGYWTMDGQDTNWATGKVTDRSGNGNTGQMLSFSTSTSPKVGKVGQALYFNGDTSAVRVGTTPALTGDFTVSFWFKRNDITNEGRILTNYNGFGGGQTVTFRFNQFSSYFIVGSTVLQPSPLNDTNWHHVVGTRNAGTGLVVLYLDSASTTSAIGTTGTLNPGSDGTLFFGGESDTSLNTVDPDAAFDGLMDDVRIYNRALSATEITQLYKQNAGAKSAVSPTTKNKDGLVAYWTFDGPDTNWATGKITDRSDNGNTGQLFNMSTTTSPTAGKIGQALNFDGITTTGSQVRIGSSASLNALNNFTASVWFKGTDLKSDDAILSKWAGCTDPFLIYAGANGKITSYITTSDTSCSDVTYNTPVIDGKWHHVTLTYDGIRQILYIDGVSVGSTPLTGTLASSGSLKIGSYDIYTFLGSIDETRIYNRALSPSEVLQLYRQGH